MQQVDEILLKKMEMIGNLRGQLVQFYQNLKREEQLQQYYQSKM